MPKKKHAEQRPPHNGAVFLISRFKIYYAIDKEKAVPRKITLRRTARFLRVMVIHVVASFLTGFPDDRNTVVSDRFRPILRVENKEEHRNALLLMVGVRRFELPASWSRTKRSTELSHTPNSICG